MRDWPGYISHLAAVHEERHVGEAVSVVRVGSSLEKIF